MICVSPGKVCPAHAFLGMRVSPHIYHYRDACVPSVMHVPPTHFTRDACFLDRNAPTQLRISNQIKLNEDIAS